MKVPAELTVEIRYALKLRIREMVRQYIAFKRCGAKNPEYWIEQARLAGLALKWFNRTHRSPVTAFDHSLSEALNSGNGTYRP